MKKLIIANWKMNPVSQEQANKLFELENKKFENLEIVICMPFVFLREGAGAQDCYWEKKGAHTGEISPEMLKNIGIKYIIIGHSEKQESDEIINKKLQAALKAGLSPVLCIENQEQLKARLKNIRQIKNLSIAYEPTWAIGTGKPCSPGKAKQMQILIRRILTQLYSRKTAEKIRILYGGSVTEKNAAEYALDGLLIGAASLDANKFIKICDAVNQKS
ncbi:MAG: triose-phosphate isomerase [bacterium]